MSIVFSFEFKSLPQFKCSFPRTSVQSFLNSVKRQTENHNSSTVIFLDVRLDKYIWTKIQNTLELFLNEKPYKMAIREIKIGDSQKRDIKKALKHSKQRSNFTHGKRNADYSNIDGNNLDSQASETWTVSLAGLW